jgi:hypothetical protein
MFRSIWTSSCVSKQILETLVLTSMYVYTVENFTLFYAPMYCTFVTYNSDCVSISRMEYTGVSYSVLGCVLTRSAG